MSGTTLWGRAVSLHIGSGVHVRPLLSGRSFKGRAWTGRRGVVPSGRPTNGGGPSDTADNASCRDCGAAGRPYRFAAPFQRIWPGTAVYCEACLDRYLALGAPFAR